MARPKRRLRGERGKPWYRKDRDQWCITQGKHKVPLRDRQGNFVRGANNETQALLVWHEMMALAQAPQTGEDNEVRVVLEMYLRDLARRKGGGHATVQKYIHYCRDFRDRWPGLLVRDLKPFHVHQWWASHPGWGASVQNMTGTILKAALNWASAPGKGGTIIPANPLQGMPLPRVRKRSAEIVVEDGEFERLMSLVKSPAMRDILTVLWETGTRPGNLALATAANLTADCTALVFDEHNTDPQSDVHKTFKKTGRALAVHLTEAAREVCVRLKLKHPEGPLFRTPTGLPWTKHRLANMVLHYAKRAGLKGRFMAYSARHSRTTALLESGVSDVDVAAIMGNTPSIIHRNYSHVAARYDRLRDIVNRHSPTAKLPDATGGPSPTGT
jgi:integrase